MRHLDQSDLIRRGRGGTGGEQTSDAEYQQPDAKRLDFLCHQTPPLFHRINFILTFPAKFDKKLAIFCCLIILEKEGGGCGSVALATEGDKRIVAMHSVMA
jgi:hypothetical protein